MTNQQREVLLLLCDRGPMDTHEIRWAIEPDAYRVPTYDRINAVLVRLRDGGYVRKSEARQWVITQKGVQYVASERGELE